MHKADEVEKVLNHMLTSFRSKMLSLPSKTALLLASKDDPKEIEALLDRDIYEALAELADYEPSLFFEEDDVEDLDMDMVGENDGTETDVEPVS